MRETHLPHGRRGPAAGHPRWMLVVATTITVPAMLLASCGSEGAAGPAASQSADPSPTRSLSSATQSTAGTGGPFNLHAGVTDGAAPVTPFLQGATLVRPDGTTLRLPHSYDQVTMLGDLILAVWADQGGERHLQLLDAGGVLQLTRPVEANFVVDPRGNLAAWATPKGSLKVEWPSGTLSLGTQGGPVSVAAVVGDGSCDAGDGGCSVYINYRDGRPPAAVSSDGTVAPVAPGAIKVNDVIPTGLAAVQLSTSDTGSCSGVYDRDLGRLLWRTCDNSLLRFSPDGRWLLASDPYLDGLGLNNLSVLDAHTGAPVAKFTIRGGFIAQWGWEDVSHPMAVVSGPSGWEILRLGLDGTRQRAVGPETPDPDPTLRMLTLAGNV